MTLTVTDKQEGELAQFGMHFRQDKIGDGLIYSSCPENFYNAGKGKIFDIKKSWFFDHNPYVVRDGECAEPINMQQFCRSNNIF